MGLGEWEGVCGTLSRLFLILEGGFHKLAFCVISIAFFFFFLEK